MRSPGRHWLAAAATVPVLAAIAVLLVLGSDHEPNPVLQLVTGLFVGLSFSGSGLIAWWRRPDNHTGRLLVLVGVTFFVSALAEANDPLLFTIGLALGPLSIAALLHLVLAYPTGTLRTRVDRSLAAGGYALAVFGQALTLIFNPEPARDFCGSACPENLLALWNDPTAKLITTTVVEVLVFLLFVAALARLVRRWRRATGTYRRSLRPVLLTGGVTFLFFAAQFAVSPLSRGTGDAINVLASIAFLTIPVGFLYGLARETLAHGAVGRLALDLQRYGPGRLGDALREVLHDPTLVLAYRLPDGGYATVDGTRIELPPAESPGLTMIEPVGAVLHDPALRSESQLLEAALATAHLSLENERLQAELAARLQELKASHARGLEAVVAERRRLERNLHDGAQQRLVALALTIRMAQAKLGEVDAARSLLDDASRELAQALEELRELARGIHPAVLSERGLGAALQSLAERAHLPVQVTRVPVERLPETVEIAAYYVVAEALTNVAKYAGADAVVVAVDRIGGLARIEVSDDGAGGADPQRGTGLSGLADRLALLGGRLEVTSPPGRGTRVSAEIPVG